MTIRKSKYTGQMMAQCDTCGDVVDFENDESFEDAKSAIDADRWRTKRGEDGKWKNICPDCQ